VEYRKKQARNTGVVEVDKGGLREVIGRDCVIFRSVGHAARRSNPRWPESWYINFELRYEGDRGLKVNYVTEEGGKAAAEVGRGARLGELSVKLTTYFPDRLVDELLELDERGATQQEMYEHMSGFYSKRGLSLPTYGTVVDTQPTCGTGRFDEVGYPIRTLDERFTDVNVFLCWVDAQEYARGAGISKTLVSAALGSDFGERCKYGLVYTKMAQFANVTKKEVSEEKANSPATAAEAREYFRMVKEGGLGDWSMRFHADNGARLLFALRGISYDKASRNAGALGLYNIKDLFDEGVLRKPSIEVRHRVA